MKKSTLDLFEEKAQMEDELKFMLCEEFASEMELPTDYVYAEFVDPNTSCLQEVKSVLDSF